MKHHFTFQELNLQAINGQWTTLDYADLPDWLASQSALEQKTSLVGIAWMHSVVPEVHQEKNPVTDIVGYQAPAIVPLIHEVVESHKYHLLNEILILLHQSRLPLPAFVMPDLILLTEKVFTQKANLRYLMPAWTKDRALPNSSWTTYANFPTVIEWARLNDKERLFLFRHLKLNGEKFDIEMLNDFWSTAKASERQQVLKIIDGTEIAPEFLQDKQNVRSKELQFMVAQSLMKCKSTFYHAILDIISQYWKKGDPRLQTMTQSIRKDLNKSLGLSQNESFGIYQYLDPSDLTNDHSDWKAIREDSLSDGEVRNFLLGALLFENLLQIKHWMDHGRFFLDEDILDAVANLHLSNYNLLSDHVVRHGKMKSDNIMRWLLCRKEFMSKPLSKSVAEFIGKSITLDADNAFLPSLIHDFCFRSDPTIYQYLLNIRERNSLAPKNILHAIDNGLIDLRIRLQFRNLLSKYKHRVRLES